jgi:hypothetical protein
MSASIHITYNIINEEEAGEAGDKRYAMKAWIEGGSQQ